MTTSYPKILDPDRSIPHRLIHIPQKYEEVDRVGISHLPWPKKKPDKVCAKSQLALSELSLSVMAPRALVLLKVFTKDFVLGKSQESVKTKSSVNIYVI